MNLSSRHRASALGHVFSVQGWVVGVFRRQFRPPDPINQGPESEIIHVCFFSGSDADQTQVVITLEQLFISLFKGPVRWKSKQVVDGIDMFEERLAIKREIIRAATVILVSGCIYNTFQFSIITFNSHDKLYSCYVHE